MRRKSTEKFMRDAMSFKAPEEVWDKIKDKPIQSVRESKAKGHPKKVWYAAAACIAACTVLISVLAVGKSLGLPASDSTLNTENGTERGGQIATDRAGEPEKKVPGETVSQTAEKTTAAVSHGGSVAGVCIPTYLDGIFELRGKKYGIVSETAYICPVPEKGEYLGEVNGVKCYEFKGKADAILVDLGKYVSPSDGSIYESLYVAELIG